MFQTIWEEFVRYVRRLDKVLLLLCLAALAFGCVILYSEVQAEFITMSKWKMQVICAGIGITALLVLSAISYRFLSRVWFLHLPVTLGLVLLTAGTLLLLF